MLISLLLLPYAKYRSATFSCIFARVIYGAPWLYCTHLIFAHCLYRANCPTLIHRTFAPAFCYLFLYHKTTYGAKCENFEISICATHDALLFFYTSHTSHPIRSCICNNHDHYISLMFIIYSLALNTQLATYTQRYENITMLTHSLDHTHHAPSIF